MTSQPVQTEISDTARALARLADSLQIGQVPAPALAHARRVVRDTLGVMLAGACLPEIRAFAALAPSLGGGRATLFGTHLQAASHVAALVNGAGGVSLELDEGNQFAVNHPAIHILPALWALAEELGSPGAAFLEAFITGYEIAVRVGRASKLRDAVHPFGTHTIVGTAVGAARLLGLDLDTTARAIELSANLPIASSQRAANSGASVRNLYTGFTNHNGLLAARLAQAGFCGEPDALRTVFGTVLGERFEITVEPHFDDFYIQRNYFKIHACSRWNHAPIEAAKEIRMRHNPAIDAVVGIEVHTYDPATRLGGNIVANAYAGKHSIAFNVAAQLVFGANGFDVYTDANVRDPRIQALIAKVSVKEDPALTALLPGLRAARVQVRLASGAVLEAYSDRPVGGFDNPLDEDALVTKFRTLAGQALPPESVAAIESGVEQLDALPHIGELARHCAIARGA